ncbi:MAG: hypothetical protein NVS3B20_08930 [Polyangiales bacterium]
MTAGTSLESQRSPAVPDSQRVGELVEQLGVLVDRVMGIPNSPEPNVAAEKTARYARDIQVRLAVLSGVAPPTHANSLPPESTTSTPSAPPEAATTLDAYNPGSDTVAPMSVRTTAMELLWICGDCGEHYPRSLNPPHLCQNCGGPKEHFFSPIED